MAAGAVLVFRAQHGPFADQPVLEDFQPADAPVPLEEVGLSANLHPQCRAALHCAEHLALGRFGPTQQVFAAKPLGKLGGQIGAVIGAALHWHPDPVKAGRLANASNRSTARCASW